MPAGTLNTLMVPVRGDGKGDNVLAHAAALARRFGARVRVVHCHPRLDDLMPFGVVVPRVLRDQIQQVAEHNADGTRDQLIAEFRELAARFGLAEQDHEPGKATARFIEYEGKQADAVRHFGRLADLICVPKPDPDRNLGANTLKSALFSSGRPVMMCPQTDAISDDFADHVAIGWNGSLEASRAVALAMPLIESAASVTILSSGDAPHAATPEDLHRYLELRGIASTITRFTPKGSVVGKALLAETDSAGAGILIMGAYRDSFERESLFGGNSQSVVDAARIPVVMVH